MSFVKLTKKVKNGKEQVASTLQKLSVVSSKLVKVTAAASRLGQRVNEPRNECEIKVEYDLMKAQIEQVEKVQKDQGDISKLYELVKDRCIKYSIQLDEIDVLFQRVVNYFNTVRDRYYYAKAQCVLALQECFGALALTRKYHGHVRIDFERCELFYIICPDRESYDKIGKHVEDPAKYKSKMIEYTSGLSGGEKSFSTICFIIAMWSAMKAPFYMLDEFDVYMDAQNRNLSQAALIGYAKLHSDNQFFFFTPLELTSIPPPAEAIVIKLHAPERNEEEASAAVEKRCDLPSTSKNRKRGGGTQEAGLSKVPRL